jgi:hypothetical protein
MNIWTKLDNGWGIRVAVDSIDDIVALLKKYNVRVTGRPKA